MENRSEESARKICSNCSAPLETKYCGRCGQKQRSPHDLSLKHFFLHTLHAFTNLDSKIFRSVNALLFRPGKLTSEWIAGREQRYMHPLQLFLVINVFYFVIVHFTATSTLTNPLVTQKKYQVYSPLIRPIIKEKIRNSGMDSIQFEKSYNETSESESKTLVIIMAPFLAAVTALLYFYKRRYFVEHLVFSIHFYAFFLIIGSAGVFILLLIAERVLPLFHIPLKSIDGDSLLTLIPGSAIFVYFFISLKRVFGGSWFWTAIKSVLLTYSVLYILFLYRFILFFTTIYTMGTGK
jgi:hypothetical protein